MAVEVVEHLVVVDDGHGVTGLDVHLPDGGGELGFHQASARGDLDVLRGCGRCGHGFGAGELARRLPRVPPRKNRRAATRHPSNVGTITTRFVLIAPRRGETNLSPPGPMTGPVRSGPSPP